MAYRVLVVEDEAMVAVGVVDMIRDSGHDVVGVAHSGEEAIEMAKQESPDMAIVDMKLPGMNGIETTKELVEKHGMAVVVLTAYTDQEFIDGAAAAGASTYLLKPVVKDTLLANLGLAAARSAELGEARKEAEDLRTAFEVRKLSERAKYVLMARLSLSEADAFSHLKQKCRNQNKTLRQASEDILAADEAFLAQIDKESPKKARVESSAR